jgi:transcriptional regulator with XRE-family HTH domain
MRPIDIRFAEVLRDLLDSRFKNRRREFAQAIHVSESALSQYVRGRATPSMSVLATMARELDVSLDYLVLGHELEPPAPEYTALVAHLESMISRTQVQSAGLKDFVGRIGTALASEIESTAARVLKDMTISGGNLTESEILRLESFSYYTRIATPDLDLDVLLLGQLGKAADGRSDEATEEVAPAQFTPVIAENVRKGFTYNYVIPAGSEWRTKARKLRQAVNMATELDYSQIDRNLRFWESARALVPSYVVYTVDRDRIALRNEWLLDQISDFIEPKLGVVALVTPPNDQSEDYILIDPKYCIRLIEDYDSLLKASPQLVFD